jgi:hypothetical protein
MLATFTAMGCVMTLLGGWFHAMGAIADSLAGEERPWRLPSRTLR